MADSPLLDLINQSLSADRLPIIAQSRDTHAPVYYGPTKGYEDPGDGVTSSDPLYLSDRAKLTLSALRKGISGVDITKTLNALPKDKGSMFVNPNPASGADTMNTVRHETIHNLLDNAGVTSKDYSRLLKTDPAGDRLAGAFKRGYRAGEVGEELPAYLGVFNPSDVPANESDRVGYLDRLRQFLLQKDSTGVLRRKFDAVTSR